MFERQPGNPGTGVLLACRREIRAGEGLVFGKYTNKIRFLLSETMKEVLYSVFDPVMTQSPKSQICSSTTASTRARGRSMKGAAEEGGNDKGSFQWHGHGWCDDPLLMLRKGLERGTWLGPESTGLSRGITKECFGTLLVLPSSVLVSFLSRRFLSLSSSSCPARIWAFMLVAGPCHASS